MPHLNKCYKFQSITKDNVNQTKHNSRLFIVPSACLSVTFKHQDQERDLQTISPLPIFMDNCLTFSRTFLAFSIQWISSPSINEDVASDWDFILLFLCFLWIKRIRRKDFKIPLCKPSGKNLLPRQSRS